MKSTTEIYQISYYAIFIISYLILTSHFIANVLNDYSLFQQEKDVLDIFRIKTLLNIKFDVPFEFVQCLNVVWGCIPYLLRILIEKSPKDLDLVNVEALLFVFCTILICPKMFSLTSVKKQNEVWDVAPSCWNQTVCRSPIFFAS